MIFGIGPFPKMGMFLSFMIPGQMISLFTENEETVQIGISALQVICFGFVVSAVSVTCSGALEALGRGMDSLFISLLRYVAIIIPAALIFSRMMGAQGVFLAFQVTEAIAAVAAFWIYRKNTDTEELLWTKRN